MSALLLVVDARRPSGGRENHRMQPLHVLAVPKPPLRLHAADVAPLLMPLMPYYRTDRQSGVRHAWPAGCITGLLHVIVDQQSKCVNTCISTVLLDG